MGPSFVETLPVRKFHGIGPATGRKMALLGIETGLDLKSQSLDFLQRHFGKAGSYYYWAARGVDEARPSRSDTQIRRRREHVSRRSLHLRSGAGRASRHSRQGMALLRGR